MQHGQILSTAPRRQTHLIDGNDLTVRLLHTAQATQEVPASWDDRHKTVSHYFREQHTVRQLGLACLLMLLHASVDIDVLIVTDASCWRYGDIG
jgi:hypothetical protein